MKPDILQQAIDVVERQLTYLEVAVEARLALKTGKYTCQCRACKYERQQASAWLQAMRAHPIDDDLDARDLPANDQAATAQDASRSQ